jgi:segregation and condensation protein A|tara:strand:- start:24 stop:686 length:663 start_codon:yes stop_codon:yes gene_type:complete
MNDSSQLSKAPLNLLVNPKTARKGKPWEVDISDLLDIFLEKIVEKDNPDLRLCGTVAFSSALLYRLKVETLFYFEKLKVQRPRIPRQGPPSLIVLPFRYELYSTSIDDLITTLEKILEDVSRQDAELKKESTLLQPEPEVEIDKFVVKIEELVADFKKDLTSKLAQSSELLFTELIRNKTLLEQTQSFLLLLFVAVEGLVTLEQIESDNNSEDIMIRRMI